MKLFKLPLFAFVAFMAGCATPGGGQQADQGIISGTSAEAPAVKVKVGKLASLATGTLLDSAKADVIDAEEMADRVCEDKTITNAVVTQEPVEGDGMWIEQWTVKRCGKLVWYNLRFVPKSDGDPTIILTRVNRQAVVIEESAKLH